MFGLAVPWAFVTAGLIARRRRPGNRTGFLMIAIGFAWIASALTDSPSDLVFTFGLVLSNFWPALLVHLLLSYPSGYLDRRSRWLVIATYIDTVGITLLMLPFSQPRLDGDGAAPNSASNLLLVSHRPGLVIRPPGDRGGGRDPDRDAAVLVIVWRRWRSATDATRRVLAPMYATGAFAVGVLLLFAILDSSITFYVFAVVFTAIPIGYLLGILRTRLDRSSAVATLVATMAGQTETGGLRDALREALNDPSLDLGYRRAGTAEYLDVSGERFELPRRPPSAR